jgi:hypothetical protein
MRSMLYRLSLSAVSILALTSGCTTQPPLADKTVPAAAPLRTVYLDGPAALARLKAEDPDHYPTVQRILASADVICSPRPGALQQAGSDAACEGMFLRTSYPPKREIHFTLGDTRYIALVVLTHAQPELTPAVAR